MYVQMELLDPNGIITQQSFINLDLSSVKVQMDPEKRIQKSILDPTGPCMYEYFLQLELPPLETSTISQCDSKEQLPLTIFQCDSKEEFEKRFPEHPFLDHFFEHVFTFWHEETIVSNWDELMAAKKAKKKAEKKFSTELKMLAQCRSMSPFWLVMNHMLVNPTLKDTFHIMKPGIEPRWEDLQNSTGGRFTFRVSKKSSHAFFKNIACELVGGMMEVETTRPGDFLCGVSWSTRPTDDLIIVWNHLSGQESEEKCTENPDLYKWQVILIDYVKHSFTPLDGFTFPPFYRSNSAK
jgi:translation initiation factor 4E